MAPSDSRRGCRPMSASRPLPSPRRVSPVARITFPTCCAHYPGGPNRCICRWLPCPRGLPRFAGGSASATSLSRPAQAITHVTARRVARPPKAAFVTRLRSGKLPNQTARQLPDLSTTIWVDSASTGYPCLCGAHSEIRGQVTHSYGCREGWRSPGWSDREQRSVAVGTEITPRPPHRSVRAAFPHTAPPSGA